MDQSSSGSPFNSSRNINEVPFQPIRFSNSNVTPPPPPLVSNLPPLPPWSTFASTSPSISSMLPQHNLSSFQSPFFQGNSTFSTPSRIVPPSPASPLPSFSTFAENVSPVPSPSFSSFSSLKLAAAVPSFPRAISPSASGALKIPQQPIVPSFATPSPAPSVSQNNPSHSAPKTDPPSKKARLMSPPTPVSLPNPTPPPVPIPTPNSTSGFAMPIELPEEGGRGIIYQNSSDFPWLKGRPRKFFYRAFPYGFQYPYPSGTKVTINRNLYTAILFLMLLFQNRYLLLARIISLLFTSGDLPMKKQLHHINAMDVGTKKDFVP